MEDWINQKLSELLDFPIPDDMITFIMQIENDRDLEDYFSTLLNNKNQKHRQFVTELKKQRASYNNQAGYKKVNDNNTIPNRQNEKKKGKGKGKENVQAPSQTQVQTQEKPDKIEKKKTKFVNLYSQGDILLKGRHRCNCEARRHSLVNNCLGCGKIVCAQEGSGPCFFCNELVCSPEQQTILQSKSKQADALYNKLMDQKMNKGLEDSLKQRDKLLEYDRNSARRTKVIDDQSDYYQSHSTWLSASEREKLQKQETEALARKHMSRLDRRIAINLMGREVTDEDEIASQSLADDETAAAMFVDDGISDFLKNINICPTIEYERPTVRSKFIERGTFGTSRRREEQTTNLVSRIQDKEYLEIFDQGLCLSLHQPYASLLVAGIKVHEGRTWYSSHRGRLWIASTVKIPIAEEITSIECSYRILKDEHIKFPESYPSGFLLGCVTVTNVLPQEEYRKLYPEGENDSPYVFICENSCMLPVPFPIKGKHKIYKLDRKLHQTASKYIEKAMKISS
ncbi:activating signal cointegrator 1 isoform X2 [Harpegnathos saltator]|nr:activating signal cointegrator 1 isoform X2 [Harpegnathos saltator]XP_025156578.1 activating signal cointegrator 1 isoform X2 [Harpegnathos saltator]XP_025156580.1 activating signal cointegrator 1 isoform X2 [Harpegnathos saltator]